MGGRAAAAAGRPLRQQLGAQRLRETQPLAEGLGPPGPDAPQGAVLWSGVKEQCPEVWVQIDATGLDWWYFSGWFG